REPYVANDDGHPSPCGGAQREPPTVVRGGGVECLEKEDAGSCDRRPGRRRNDSAYHMWGHLRVSNSGQRPEGDSDGGGEANSIGPVHGSTIRPTGATKYCFSANRRGGSVDGRN